MGRRRRRRTRSRRTRTRTSRPRRNTRKVTGRTSRSKQRSTGAGTRSSKAKSSGKSRGGARSGGKSGATKKAKRAVRRVTRAVGRAANKVKKTLKTKSPRGVRTNRMKNRLKNRPVRTKDTKVAQNQGPVSNIKKSKETGKFEVYGGAGRPGKVRMKEGFGLPQGPINLAANNIKNLGITNREKTYFSQKDPSSYGYGTATPKATTPKSNMDKIRDAARARHENFKKTGVQTFGGTRQNYSTREAEKIRDAGLNFSKVTGGAKNPLARAPINPNIKVGELMPGVEGFGMTDADKFMSINPNVNYDFSKRDTNLPSMSTLAKSDLSGFSKSLGINRDNFGGGKNAFSASPSDLDLGYTMRDMFQAKDLGNMTTNALTQYVPGLTIRPQSMADRDKQTFLGFNPNKPSRNLKATDPGRPKSQQQGTTSYLEPVNTTAATTAPADEETVTEEEVQPDPVEQNLPDLEGITQDEYDATMEAITGGGENVTGSNSTTPDVATIAQTTGIDPGIIERILAGYRGKKRIKFGTGKNESLKLRRGNVGFMSRIPQFTLSSLNV
tara:strand:+ start:206 stop:1870 length:1665 start_codon:yes stop_codon:yes gene_type:complete